VKLREEQMLIADWIRPGSRVLDLGCGDGSLLARLKDERDCTGYGIEIDRENIVQCIGSGVNVIQSDLDRGLSDFDDDSFDYVVMTQTLQAVHYPNRLLREMLRVGREGIVTFPNFGHWRCRLQVLAGRMPVTRNLPNTWYDTQNIHMCTVRDFEALCALERIEILQHAAVDTAHRSAFAMQLLPNLFSEIAIYRFRRRASGTAGGAQNSASEKS